MWLLKTDCAELTFFPTPESVPRPGYAILSHVWSPDPKDEQSFQATNEISSKCALDGKNPRGLASEKIRLLLNWGLVIDKGLKHGTVFHASLWL